MGIMFFLRDCRIHAIHVHTAAAPHASPTLEGYMSSEAMRRTMNRCYAPISPNNCVLAISSRTDAYGRLNFLVWPTFHRRPARKWATITQKTGLTLIYQIRTRLVGTIAVGQFDDGEPVAPFDYTPREYSPNWIPYGFRLAAPLKNVASLTLFYARLQPKTLDAKYCRGILLEYENGGQRAIGECRIGVDQYQIYRKPSRICYRYLSLNVTPSTWETTRTAMKVEGGSDDESDHTNEEEGWKCCGMQGRLDFWFWFPAGHLTWYPS